MKTVAAFDFDGTLTYFDSFLPFLFFSFGKAKTFSKLFFQLPVFFLYCIGKRSRKQVKENLLAAFLKGMAQNDVSDLGKKFAEGPLSCLIREKAFEKLKWHQDQGHISILISANFSFYLSHWASCAGFDHILATDAAIDKNHLLTGKIQGENCYGKEKVKRLKALIKEPFTLYAYGDSPGDKDLLELADYPFFKKFQ